MVREHIEKRAAMRILGYIYFRGAVSLTKSAVYGSPIVILLRSAHKFLISRAKRFEGYDPSCIPDGSKLLCVLTDTRADIQDNVSRGCVQYFFPTRKKMSRWRISYDIITHTSQPSLNALLESHARQLLRGRIFGSPAGSAVRGDIARAGEEVEPGAGCQRMGEHSAARVLGHYGGRNRTCAPTGKFHTSRPGGTRGSAL